MLTINVNTHCSELTATVQVKMHYAAEMYKSNLRKMNGAQGHGSAVYSYTRQEKTWVHPLHLEKLHQKASPDRV